MKVNEHSKKVVSSLFKYNLRKVDNIRAFLIKAINKTVGMSYFLYLNTTLINVTELS